MKGNKICAGCHGRIERKKERYTHVEDWNKMDIVGESWWHLQCFKKAMNRDKTLLEKKAEKMLDKASNLYNNLPDELKQEVYKIC